MTQTSNTQSESTSLRPLRGLLIAQIFGAFNDNAFKQIVVLLAMGAVASEAEKQQQGSIAQALLVLAFMVTSLPAGVLADRMSKRTMIIGLKGLELALLLLAAAALWFVPGGGVLSFIILGLLGAQAGLYSPAKYGILPELVPHERLSRGNALLETCSNLSILAGIVAAGALLAWTTDGTIATDQPWLGVMVLAGLSAVGLAASLTIPNVPAARGGGGIAETVRGAWATIRADRVLELAVRGQVFLWTVASVIPILVLAYADRTLGLADDQKGFPLASLGIGVGMGCLLAGKLSASKVEYGLLPLGALGITVMALWFSLTGPGVIGTNVIMALTGIFSGLLMVPLNAILQWRAPADRRGAVISLCNVLVFAGMFVGSLVTFAVGEFEISARQTFFGLGVIVGGGFWWALTLVPDAFLRFLLVMLANTMYRIQVRGRDRVPLEGGALLVPNHVTWVDGLWIIASTDRQVRFLVDSSFFERPIMRLFLRAIRAIPVSAAGGPRMILKAFRDAGKHLDDGELVCIFAEGQLSRTGLMQPFRRGLERIMKGRAAPIIPVHLDRGARSIFSPTQRWRLPDRVPYPVTVSFGEPLSPDVPVPAIRQTVQEMGEDAWWERKRDARPLHHSFIRRCRRHPIRLAFADQEQRLGGLRALAATIALARSVCPKWEGQERVGILLPPSVAGSLVNIAASLAGRTAVNLNFTAGRAGMESAIAQAGLKTIVTSRAFLEKAKIEPPAGCEILYVEDVVATIQRGDRWRAMALALFAPIGWLERVAGATRRPSVDDIATVIFSSGSTGEPKGVMLSHFNVDSNVQAIAQVFRVQPHDRMLGVLPLFHSFGYTALWLAATQGLGTVCHPSPLDAGMIGDLVERHRVTTLLTTPTFLQLYMRRCTPGQFGSLRIIMAGAERIPETLATTFEYEFGVRPLEGYGMTECSPVVAVSTLDFRSAGIFQPGSRRGFVGQPLPGVALRVVDPETFTPLPANTPGMILVRGPNVMRGYLGRDDLTQAAIHDGWYVTGDIGWVDDDGFLKITDRLSRFSKIGGEMVPHGRVEEALHRAAGLDVQTFAVTAVGDQRKGERLAVLHTASDESVANALATLANNGFPNLFIPRRDDFIRVDALPVLGTGKLDLRAIKKIATETLGR
jgi:acyl-[acyl-carrier-protein]-phospholipid O-acyltransferase/long-chain-fatty-acid--[acyl-carrier-protein] ligase